MSDHENSGRLPGGESAGGVGGVSGGEGIGSGVGVGDGGTGIGGGAGAGAGASNWPVADLDPVRRMHVLASALPAGAYGQLHIDAPLDRVWHYLADLDRSIPDLIGFIRRFDLAADRSAAVATGPLGNRGRFAVELRDGWCVMQDRFVVGGFAAAADGDGTLVAGCGAVRTPGLRKVAPLLFGERAVLRTLGKVRERVAQDQE